MQKDTSTNLSKIKRDNLIEICENLKLKNPENTLEINKIISHLKEKKYGLIFEQHEENIDVMLRNYIPIFKEFDNLNQNKNTSDYNFLLEGDNLHSLKLLEKTHKNKIDVIYIDPPYNTLNEDFVYGDKMMDEEDGYKHSKWLSFMKERLELAQKLLTDDGLIFISIDDCEFAQLKLLCNNIFNENNFVTTICVELSKTQGMKVKAAQKGTIVKGHEYILVYCKDIKNATINRFPLYDKVPGYDRHFYYYVDENKNVFKLIDKMQKEKSLETEIKKLSQFKSFNLKNIDYFIDNSNIIKSYIFDNAYKIYSDGNVNIKNINDYTDLLSETKAIEIINEDKKYMVIKTSNGTPRQLISLLSTLHYTDDFYPEYTRSTIRGALWKDFHLDMGNISKEGNIEFKNGKKPKRLIKQLLKYTNRPNATVLDFFAGSGTTAQAVMELNKEKNFNMKFILCTNNEINSRQTLKYLHSCGHMLKTKATDKTTLRSIKSKIDTYFKDKEELKKELFETNKLEYEKYGICQTITYPRIKNVMNEMKKDYCINLKYFQTEMIEKTDPDLKNKICNYIETLIELQHLTSLNSSKIKVIWDTQDLRNLMNLDLSELELIYMDQEEVVPYSDEVKFLEQLKNKGIQIKDIPHYYYKEVK